MILKNAGRLVWTGVLVCGLVSELTDFSLAYAQETSSTTPVTDAAGSQPGTPVRVARLTFVAGDVEVHRVDNTADDAPVLNMPLVEGTRLSTGDYGQAEIEFEDGSVVRLTPRSALTLDVLMLYKGAAHTQMTLLGGLAYFELRYSDGFRYHVGAGGVLMNPLENTTVRLSLGETPATFSVVTGSVRVDHVGAFHADVHAGESLRVDAEDENRYFLNGEVAADRWDEWNTGRDQLAADEADKRTTARDAYAGVQGYGWSDLDSNGNWYNVPGEGQVWQPDAADAGFDPYGYGNWVWGSGGYVWASGYSWGWTPFRCGRWNFYPGFGWAWRPSVDCGVWGSGFGGGVAGVFIGHAPIGYRPVRLPLHGPGKVHPILPVRGPGGLRPASGHSAKLTVAGVPVVALRPVGSGMARSGSVVGQALNRDFPVDLKTQKPVFGLTGRLAMVGGVPTTTTPGWRPVVSRPVGAREGTTGVLPGSAARTANQQQTTRQNGSTPARTGTPVTGATRTQVQPSGMQTTRPASPPVSQAAPVRSAPVAAPPPSPPPPPPVHTAPPPSAPPSAPPQAAPAPATSKPKS